MRSLTSLLAVAGAAWLFWTLDTGAAGPLTTAELGAIGVVASALMLVGVVGCLHRPARMIGALVAATGFGWAIQLLRFSHDSLPWTVSLVAPILFIGSLVHLAFIYPPGRAMPRAERYVVAVVYAAVALAPLAVAVFSRDPGSLGYEGFPRNLVLVAPEVDVWETLSAAQAVLHAALGLVVAVLVGRRWAAARRTARRSLVPAAVTGSAGALLLALPLIATGTDARSVLWLQTPWGFAQWLGAAALVAAAVALAAGLLRASLVRSGVAELVVDLDRSTSSDALRGALMRTLRDPSLSLALWDPDGAHFVDLAGEAVQLPPAGSQQAVTLLERRGRRVGALIHDAALRDEPGLIEAAAAAVRIALENDRLHDELRAQLEAVRASRARIVEAGDRERRRLERNLHDGAQQKLVSLAVALRLAERRADADAELRERLEQATELLRGALADVRALAQGLHPPILREEGLSGALEALAATLPVPVRVVATPQERLPDAVEIAAYFVVSEALTNVAKYARAQTATVSAIREDGRLVVDVADDGVGGADAARGSGLRGLADRLAAIDGRLEIDSPSGGGTRLHAEIPCGS